MSEFFEINNRNPQSCSFSGNGTVNPRASTAVSAASIAASSCISNPSATFTPSITAVSGTGGAAAGTSQSGSTTKSSAVSLVDRGVLMGLSAMALLGVVSALWTLS